MKLDASKLSAISANLGTVAASGLERVEGFYERTRERVTMTGGLLLVALVVGFLAGATASKPLHRWQINQEWRARIASKSETVRQIIAKGGADADELDRKIIAELGVHDERLRVAEQGLENASRNDNDNGGSDGDSNCRIPAWRLLEK